MSDPAPRPAPPGAARALQALNFFMADMQAGIGPFLGVFLPQRGGDAQGRPAGFVAMTIVVAQAVMIVASIATMTMAEKQGYWWVIPITFIAQPAAA